VDVLQQIDRWGAGHAGACIVRADGDGLVGVAATHGDLDEPLRIASIAKLLTAYALMVAVEEGTVTLDDPAGPPGSTLRHLLAHASGYGFDSDAIVLARPATRRIYSNRGIEEAAAHLSAAAAMPFADYLREAVLEPLALASTELRGSPAFGIWSTVRDLTRFVGELLAPRLIAPETLATMTTVQLPGLPGVLPNVGRFEQLDWGLGFERNFAKPGHWAGTRVSDATFGHFGGAGTFLWVDPVAGVGCVCLTDREFGPWAMDVWPPFCDDVIDATKR
jgi:CubicO group peptidase (beta-lactamase class C family)